LLIQTPAKRNLKAISIRLFLAIPPLRMVVILRKESFAYYCKIIVSIGGFLAKLASAFYD